MNYEANGQLNKIIDYIKNKDNTYWVCLVVVNNNNKYKIIGNVKFMPEVGDYITANGIYDKYNNEICINKSNIIIELPKDQKSIYERLCNIYSDQINENIINVLSNIENIWTLLENKQLENININNYNYLYEQYYEYIKNRVNCEYQKLYNFLISNFIKLNKNQIKNLLDKYLLAQTIINIIIDKDNDYKILELLNVESIGMKTLLNICNALNMSDNKKINIYIVHSLLNNPDGHSCLKINELQNILYNFCNKYKIKYKNFDNNLKNLEINNYIYIFENYIYAKQYYEAEIEISKYLVNLFKSKSLLQKYYLDANEYIYNNDYQNDRSKKSNNDDYTYALNEQQKEACMQMFKYNFCINTGKAGTGKSESLMIPLLFFDKYYDVNISILCLSPTGKACVRLNNEFQKPENQLNHIAYTIHKFNYYKDKQTNNYYKDKQINIDVFNTILDKKSDNIKLIIIDEFSMVDLLTFYEFIKKIKCISNICLVLLGDYNQLPSVSAGNILNRLIKSNIFSVTKLTKVVRSDGGIVTMSNNVLECNPLFNNINKDNKSVNWLQINPEDYKNKQCILDNIKLINEPLILSTTNKLIDNLHEDIKLTLNTKLDIPVCISNFKLNANKQDIKVINNLELEIITYKKLFDNGTIYNDKQLIYEFISNEIKNEINNKIKEYFDSSNFSLKNITNYLYSIDIKKTNKLVIKFKNNYCKKFNKINEIFNNLNLYIYNKYFNYLLNMFINDFNDNFIINNYRLYDKIMITKNKYEKDLMNGMIGEIIAFKNYEKELLVNFDNKIITLYDDDFENIKLAFIITIHKEIMLLY